MTIGAVDPVVADVMAMVELDGLLHGLCLPIRVRRSCPAHQEKRRDHHAGGGDGDSPSEKRIAPGGEERSHRNVQGVIAISALIHRTRYFVISVLCKDGSRCFSPQARLSDTDRRASPSASGPECARCG